MTGNIEANRDIYADILNTGQIHDHRTLNLIIADLRQIGELLAQSTAEMGTGQAPLSLPPGWPEAMQLLARDERATPPDRHQAYAAWLVNRQAQKPAQRLAARDRYVQLKATLATAGLMQQFTGWYPQPDGPPQARKLADVTEAINDHAALVLLGAPGSGKTTVLYRLQHQAAQTFLAGRSKRLPLLVSLAGYRWEQQDPLTFLRQQWQAHVADDFMELVRAGSIMLLLDGLNEMRRLTSYRDHQQRVNDWEHLLQNYFAADEGDSQAVVASRTADYEQTLDLPRVEIDPLDDEQIYRFLQAYLGDEAVKALAAIKRLDLLDLARTPYSLAVLTDLYDPQRGDLPPNQGRLFAVYADRLLLAEKKQTDLPLEAARLALNRLGYHMQQAGESTTLPAEQLEALLPAVVQIPGRRQPVETPSPAVFDLACRAGLIALDPGAGPAHMYKFTHHLLQEQFAAADLLRRWQTGEDLAGLWRVPRTQAEMPPAEAGNWDPLPPPPPTGWEQTTLMAAGLLDWADTFVRAMLAVNPALAGRCLSEGAASVNPETRRQAGAALLADLSNPALHRRLRLQAGQVLASEAVGDPRFTPVSIEVGASGHSPLPDRIPVTVILPDLVEVPGGPAVLGSDDEEAFDNERPVHRVEIAPFYLARYPVTNAEYGCFIDAGGYDTGSYWTPAGWLWRQGQSKTSGQVEQVMEWYRFYSQDLDRFEALVAEDRFTPKDAEAWRSLFKLSEKEALQRVSGWYPVQAHNQPSYWDDPAYNQSNRPVVGVTWYEAMAYCAWLNERISEWANPALRFAVRGQRERIGDSTANERTATWEKLQSSIVKGRAGIRLPTEAEWEWAAGGPDHSRYPWGNQFDPEKANTLEGRVLGTSPVGAYPAGAAQGCGALDLAGNVWEWTHTLFAQYPYRPDDGREDPGAEGRRMLRGGSWNNYRLFARVSSRTRAHPDYFFDYDLGFRVVVAPVLSF